MTPPGWCDQPCLSPLVTIHVHHTCWNCGGEVLSPNLSYKCECGCEGRTAS